MIASEARELAESHTKRLQKELLEHILRGIKQCANNGTFSLTYDEDYVPNLFSIKEVLPYIEQHLIDLGYTFEHGSYPSLKIAYSNNSTSHMNYKKSFTVYW